VLSRPIEYLSLRGALAVADSLPEQERLALLRRTAEAWQKRDAAELLVSRSSVAEAIRLALECASLVSQCMPRVAESSLLQGRRVRRAVSDLTWACAHLTPAPALDVSVTRAQARALRTLLIAEVALESPLRDALRSRSATRWLRIQRILAALAVVLSPLAALLFVESSFLGIKARASSVLDDQYAADRALDGDPDTEWVAGPGEEWLEIRFRPRKVHTVRILNGDTLPDRAVKEMHVDFYDHGNSHPTTPKTFGEQHPAQWITYDVGGLTCDRIRIVITQHYGSGAAIAEVEIN
jgi:hypothetical protein